jgi:hypothetical protein
MIFTGGIYLVIFIVRAVREGGNESQSRKSSAGLHEILNMINFGILKRESKENLEKMLRSKGISEENVEIYIAACNMTLEEIAKTAESKVPYPVDVAKAELTKKGVSPQMADILLRAAIDAIKRA